MILYNNIIVIKRGELNERNLRFNKRGGEDLMSVIIMVLIGYVIGLSTMTIISFYKWFLKIWTEPR